MYNNAKAIASGKVDLEVSWGTVGGILLLGFFYMVTASIGIGVFSKCDSMKGKPVQENLNKYLAATLTIALTIPFTLLVTKLAKNEAGVFMLIYSLMGLVGAAAASTGPSSVQMPRRPKRATLRSVLFSSPLPSSRPST
jgi:hypothetical protein